ncbi:hypothetical protein H312_00392 [Anncaliia algerae PRA339]|uniref:Uncharacterized protein n=1 Tax=Anncaliia algerae PRA339 TaxID=1288291 RepID=A0A059F4W0_9MICR|nr:hypothetical protein H312_00392 [Anncaliia algerae PRA339]
MQILESTNFKSLKELWEVLEQKKHGCKTEEEKHNILVLFKFICLYLTKKCSSKLSSAENAPIARFGVYSDDRDLRGNYSDYEIECSVQYDSESNFNSEQISYLKDFTCLGMGTLDWVSDLKKFALINGMKDDLKNLFKRYNPNNSIKLNESKDFSSKLYFDQDATKIKENMPDKKVKESKKYYSYKFFDVDICQGYNESTDLFDMDEVRENLKQCVSSTALLNEKSLTKDIESDYTYEKCNSITLKKKILQNMKKKVLATQH